MRERCLFGVYVHDEIHVEKERRCTCRKCEMEVE